MEFYKPKAFDFVINFFNWFSSLKIIIIIIKFFAKNNVC